MHLIQLLIGLGIVYFVPVWSRPDAILSPPFILAALGGTLLFVVQPGLNKRDLREHTSDRRSALTIFLAGVLAHMLPVIEWRMRGFPWPSSMQVAGVAVVIAGLAFRFYAIHVLGRYFTATVQVQAGHTLITRSPFSKVRHPSYLGALVAIAGHALILSAPVSALVVTLGMFLAYRKRIGVEEAALRGGLGMAYAEYQARTNRLVPHLW